MITIRKVEITAFQIRFLEKSSLQCIVSDVREIAIQWDLRKSVFNFRRKTSKTEKIKD